MSLKLRYAAFLLIVIVLLALFCSASVYFLTKGHYLATVCLLAILYLTTFLLGKKFSKIFFVLSFLRLLRKNNGVMLTVKYEAFIRQAVGNRKSSKEKSQLQHEILECLQKEGVVKISDNSIFLLSP